MPVDQVHAVVKGDGGAIGLTEDPSALKRWMVTGPELRRLLNEFEIASSLSQITPADNKHHEDFNFKSLVKTLSELGNPFLKESRDLYKLDTKEVADPESANSENPLNIGLKQYESFFERLIKDRLL